jgi:hypothetical protein
MRDSLVCGIFDDHSSEEREYIKLRGGVYGL